MVRTVSTLIHRDAGPIFQEQNDLLPPLGMVGSQREVSVIPRTETDLLSENTRGMNAIGLTGEINRLSQESTGGNQADAPGPIPFRLFRD